MAVIGALNVLLQASTSGLTAGLAKAKEKATDFVKSWIPSWQSVGLAVGAAALAAGAAFAVLAKQAADNAGRLDDLAQNIGTTVDHLHALEYAAHMSGVSAGDLEGILSKLNILLAEAAMNGGPTAKALERIGLSASELTKLDITDAFKKIADGLAGVEHEGMRASLAMDILGKAGTKAIQFAGRGAKGIEELEARAKRLGIVMSQVDADKLNAAQDALDDIAFVVQGLGAKLAADLAPALVSVVELFTEGETTGKDMLDMINDIADVTVIAGAVVIGVFDAFYDSMMLARTGFYATEQAVIESVSTITKAANRASKALGLGKIIDTTEIENFRSDVETARAEVDRLTGIATKSNAGIDFWEKYNHQTNVFTESLKKNRDALIAQADAMNKGEAEAEKWIEQLQEQLQVVGMSTDEAKLWKLEQQEINSLLTNQARSLLEQIKLKEEAIEKEKELAKAGEDSAKKAKEAVEKQIEAMRDKIKADKEARKNAADAVRESVKTDKEKRGDEIARLTQMLFAGDINEDTFNKAFKKAKSGEPQESRFAGLALAGSAEARSSILRNQSLNNNPQNKIADNTAKMLLEAKKQTENLVKVVTGVQKFQVAKW
ncbi:hypothetical protein [Anatilimnocola floriformis]|uniref:hypothetical protein n=1 Tax=Anatilimnocola floriformis TaxID=2948575 RepID=UPI0020C1C41B|nr:hypothetical protein [Anatilimnocola floriformis]